MSRKWLITLALTRSFALDAAPRATWSEELLFIS
jgi:hypothetical protein